MYKHRCPTFSATTTAKKKKKKKMLMVSRAAQSEMTPASSVATRAKPVPSATADNCFCLAAPEVEDDVDGLPVALVLVRGLTDADADLATDADADADAETGTIPLLMACAQYVRLPAPK